MDANESFELAAEAFRAASGFLAPGKDGSGADYKGRLAESETARAWNIWCAAIEHFQSQAAHRIDLEKLDIKDGDLVVMKSDQPFDAEFFNALHGRIPDHKVLFVNLGPNDEVSTIPEADMAAHGWYRKENTDE